jgi:GNAT superfamily N-acetyltransferase
MNHIRISLVAKPWTMTSRAEDLLNELEEETFPGDDIYDKENCYWWVAYIDGIPVGFAGLKLLEDQNEGLAWFPRAGVLKDARRCGIHHALIKARLAYATKLGVQEVITYTVLDNEVSSNHLMDLGFRLYTPETRWVGDVLYWRKVL